MIGHVYNNLTDFMLQPDNFYYLMLCLFAGIATIVLLTVKFRIHAFFALILACFVVGLGLQMPILTIVGLIKDGFGNIMKSLSMIIVLGTTLGILLEHSGSTTVMAAYILRKIGERRAAFSLSLTGLIGGLPLFCDSGYIVLSGLNRPLAKRTGISIAVLSACLSTGLYAVHCLIPPHPGASAAAGIIGVDLGRLILIGFIVSIPAMLVGYIWAVYAGRKHAEILETEDDIAPVAHKNQPSVVRSFLPVLVPILLIAIKSFITVEQGGTVNSMNVLSVLGDPVIALGIGVLLAFSNVKGDRKGTLNHLLEESISKAGVILVIIGAGGSFGAVLAAAKIGESFSNALPLAQLGILLPFLLAFLLKTAQGSSTVAIITASSIVLPLLPALGLNDADGKLLVVLAMGAGSMMISHANDSYFWVIAKFSGLNMKTMLYVYSLATFFMGIVAFAMICLLSMFL